MAEPLSDERLELVLASVGEHLEIPETEPADLSLPGSSRRRWVAAAAVVIAAGGLVVSPVRDAVADWFGFGLTAFERAPWERADPAGLPPLDAGLPMVSTSQAAALLGRPLPTTPLGEPDRIAVPPEGGVVLAWDTESTTLWLLPTVDPAAVRMRKVLDEYDVVEPVEGLGEGAVSVEGDHVLATPNRRVAARSVVLWIDDGVEYRLESDRAAAEMVDLARSVI